MDWLNYHHLLYFYTVAKVGGVTAASKQLSLAQSTVSAQIRMLEDQLGGPLFARVGRRMELTELGQMVYGYADEIFALGREMLDTVKGRPIEGPLRVTIGIVDAMPKLVARRILEPVLRMTEPVRLICVEGSIERLLADLAINHLDLVLSDVALGTGLNVRAYSHLLGETGLSFFAHKKVAESLTGEFPYNLDQAPMLMPVEGSVARRTLDHFFERYDVHPAVRGEFADSALQKAFGQAGDGVFSAPRIIEADVAEHDDVVVIGRSNTALTRFYAISVERKIKHPAVVAIWEAARQSLFAKPNE
jgi:LysR family transcriptional activator of nhaA